MNIDSERLIYRIDNMEYPSRWVDAEIAIMFDIQAYAGWGVKDHIRIYGPDAIKTLADAGDDMTNIWYNALPRYTSSVDTVLASFPGWAFPHMKYRLGSGWMCQVENSLGIEFDEYTGTSHADRPYGYVFAMLTALIRLQAGQIRSREERGF